MEGHSIVRVRARGNLRSTVVAIAVTFSPAPLSIVHAGVRDVAPVVRSGVAEPAA